MSKLIASVPVSNRTVDHSHLPRRSIERSLRFVPNSNDEIAVVVLHRWFGGNFIPCFMNVKVGATIINSQLVSSFNNRVKDGPATFVNSRVVDLSLCLSISHTHAPKHKLIHIAHRHTHNAHSQHAPIHR